MTGPKRLWSGEWLAESAAARSRIAERRGLGAGVDGEPPGEPPAEPPAPREPVRERLRRALLAALATVATGWRSLVARARRASARPRLPRGRRTRLVAIAVIAGVAGAAAMIGIEAASGAGNAPAAPLSSRPYLGVELETSPFEPGAEVVDVIPGSPANGAGVTVGDVITSVNGRSVTSSDALVAAIAALRPGAAVRLELDRTGQPLTITVTLGSQPLGAP